MTPSKPGRAEGRELEPLTDSELDYWAGAPEGSRLWRGAREIRALRTERSELVSELRSLRARLADALSPTPPAAAPDRAMRCATCAKETPHRFRPSPEAGPYWRCSECGEARDEVGSFHAQENLAAPVSAAPRWRVGTKLGRTLYRDGVCVGMLDTPELAREVVAALNAAPVSAATVECDCEPQPSLVKSGTRHLPGCPNGGGTTNG